MDYSEEAYENLIKMRELGKKDYDEERYSQSIKDLHDARNLKMAQSVLEKAKKMVYYRRDIIDGKIKDPEMTDTMYEMHGYRIKEKADKFFEEWTNRVCPKGYWTPGM